MRRSIVVAVLCFCACGPPARDAAPPLEAPVAPVEPETPATVETAGKPVDGIVLLTLMECWLRSPYDYMFGGGAGVTVNGRFYGMLQAGIGGILYYGDLNNCAGEVTDTKAKSYSDNSTFSTLSGLPIHSDLMDGTRKFGYYNPELVKWGHTNLVPHSEVKVHGVPVQLVYDGVFQRFFRMMTESYLYLENSGTYRQEMDAYLGMAQSGQDGIDWLQARYSGVLTQYGGAWDGTTMTPQMAIGFWLRRGLDGTSGELWTGLKKVMGRFDAEWFLKQKAAYPDADVEW